MKIAGRQRRRHLTCEYTVLGYRKGVQGVAPSWNDPQLTLGEASCLLVHLDLRQAMVDSRLGALAPCG